MISTRIKADWDGAAAIGLNILDHRDYFFHEVQLAGASGESANQDVTVKARPIDGNGFVVVAESAAGATAENEFGRSIKFSGQYEEIIVEAAGTFSFSAVFDVILNSVNRASEVRKSSVLADGTRALSGTDRLAGIAEGHQEMLVHQVSLTSPADTGTYRLFGRAVNYRDRWVRIGTLDLTNNGDQTIVMGRYRAFMVEKTTSAGGSEALTLTVSSTGNDESILFDVNGLIFLTRAEVAQLANIDLVTISNTQWGYLGAMDQGVATTDDVQFTNVNVSDTGSVIPEVRSTNNSAVQLRLRSDSTNRRILARTDADSTVSQVQFPATNVVAVTGTADNNGSLAVGKTTASATLDVAGDGAFESDLAIQDGNAVAGNEGVYNLGDATTTAGPGTGIWTTTDDWIHEVIGAAPITGTSSAQIIPVTVGGVYIITVSITFLRTADEEYLVLNWDDGTPAEFMRVNMTNTVTGSNNTTTGMGIFTVPSGVTGISFSHTGGALYAITDPKASTIKLERIS